MWTKENFINEYEKRTAAQGYIIGFIYKHDLYMVEREELPADILKVERAAQSKGGHLKLRVRMNNEMKEAFIASGAVRIGIDADVDKTPEHPYNKGENFERIITEMNGLRWEKDSVPFWVQGDIRVNGKEIQIKLDGAEITNEKTMQKLLIGA